MVSLHNGISFSHKNIKVLSQRDSIGGKILTCLAWVCGYLNPDSNPSTAHACLSTLSIALEHRTMTNPWALQGAPKIAPSPPKRLKFWWMLFMDNPWIHYAKWKIPGMKGRAATFCLIPFMCFPTEADPQRQMMNQWLSGDGDKGNRKWLLVWNFFGVDEDVTDVESDIICKIFWIH